VTYWLHDGKRPAANSDCDGSLGERYWSAQSNGPRQMSAKTRRLGEDTDRETHPDRYSAWRSGRQGLLDRRLLLGTGALLGFIPSIGKFGVVSRASAETSPLTDPGWSKNPGSPFVGYGQPSKFEAGVVRTPTNPPNAPGAGAAWAPLHRLHGTITPPTVSISSAAIVVFPT
jgi:hypothetical protein